MDRRAEDPMKMPKVGAVVEIWFLDHGSISKEEDEEVEPCVVYGQVARNTDVALIVDCWRPSEEMDRGKAYRHSELESFVVIKAAIVDWWALGRRSS